MADGDKTDFAAEVPTHGILGTKLWDAARKCTLALLEVGMDSWAAEIARACRGVEHNRFTVAVVGEFNRGKSTLVNRLLARNVLPVGDLPTTALFTRIVHGKDESLTLVDASGTFVRQSPLSAVASDELTLHHFGGENFLGSANISVNAPWLEAANLALCDTPGAGDLEEERCRRLSDMLLGCDGVIVTVSATAPLSQSERTFIEQRVLARKFGAMMVVVTKLDQIAPAEREGVLDYIHAKLRGWKLDVPVVALSPDDEASVEAIRRTLTDWTALGDRVRNSRTWVAARISEVLNLALADLREKQALLQTQDAKTREAHVARKRTEIDNARIAWARLSAEMQARSNACYGKFSAHVAKLAPAITEKLQYECRHSNNLIKWVKDDLPYRIKIELAGMATMVESLTTRDLNLDARWFNAELTRIFHSTVNVTPTPIFDNGRFGSYGLDGDLPLDNLETRRNVLKIGSSVLAISGAAFFSSVGCWPLFATMGVGTAGGILSERIIRDKLEDQRRIVQDELAKCMPSILRSATADSEKRLNDVYDRLVGDGNAKVQAWLEAQGRQLTDVSAASGASPAGNAAARQIEFIENALNWFNNG